VGFDGQAPLRSVSGQTGAADDAKDFLVPLNEHTETARGGLFPCACERHLKPEGHAFPIRVMFTNLTSENITVFWLDYKGERVAIRTHLTRQRDSHCHHRVNAVAHDRRHVGSWAGPLLGLCKSVLERLGWMANMRLISRDAAERNASRPTGR
jgi:hypothetical protein